MPEARIYTTNRGYPLVRKALNSAEVWDWFAEYLDLWTAADLDVQGLQDDIDALAALVGPNTADYIKLQSYAESTESSVQDYINDFPGAGIVSQGTISDNGDGTVTVGEAVVLAAKTNTPGAQKAYFTIPEKIVALTAGYSNYIVVDLSGAAPYEFTAVLDPSTYLHRQDRIMVDIVYRETDGTVRATNTSSGYRNFYTQFSQKAFDFAEGRGFLFVERAKGALLGADSLRHPTLTAGAYWADLRLAVSPEFDTAGTDTMIRFYRDGSGGWVKQTGQTQLDYTYYDNGSGTLVAMNNNQFKCVSMYILFDGEGFVELEGQAQYTSLALAEEEPRPTIIPPLLANFSIYLGRYIVQEGNDIVIVESAFTTELAIGPITSHNSLSNLNVDPLYQHYNSDASLVLPTGWEVQNAEFGSDTASVKLRDVTLIRSNVINGNATRIDTGCGHLFSLDATTGLQRINMNAMDLQETNPLLTSIAPLSVLSSLVMLQLQASSLLVINVNTLEFETIAQSHGTIYSCYSHPETRKTYALNTAGNLIILSASYPYAIAETHAIAGIVNPVRSIIVDSTEAYAYVFEGPATSGNAYIKKISLSTWAVTATSTAIPTVNATYGSLMWSGDNMVLTHDNNISATTHTCDIYDTNVTRLFDGQTTITGTYGAACSGLLFKLVSGSGTFEAKLYQLPAMVHRLPAHIDASALSSSVVSQLIDKNGNRVIHTLKDFQRAAIRTHNPALLQGAAALTDPGFTIANGEWGSDEAAFRFNALTPLRTYPNALTDFNTFNMAYGDFLFFGLRTASKLYKISRETGEILAETPASSMTGYRGLIIQNEEIVSFVNTTIRIVNIETFEARAVSFASGVCDATGGADVSPNGTIIAAKGDGLIYQITNSGNDVYSSVDISPGGLTAVKDVICDDTHYFVIDQNVDFYIRKYDIATSTLQVSSAVQDGTSRGFSFVGEHIFFVSTTSVNILNKDLVSLAKIPHASTGNAIGTIADGILYAIDAYSFLISSYQLPSLTSIEPDFVESLGGNGIYSVESLPDFQWTKRDVGDAVRLAHNPALMAGQATVGDRGLVIHNREYGDQEVRLGEFRDLQSLLTFVTSDNGQYIAARGRYIVVSENNSTNDLVLYDRFTGIEIKRVTQSYGPVEFIDDTHIVVMSAVDLDYLTIPDLNVYQNATITPSSLCDVGVGTVSSKVYVAGGGNALSRRLTDGTYDSTTGALPSMIGAICAFLLSDDEQTLYVIDAASGSASACWFRIYDISTFSSPTLTGSLQLTSTVNGELYSKLGWQDGYICAAYTRGGTNISHYIALVDVSTPASPSISYDSTAKVNSHGVYIVDGLLYLATYLYNGIAQLPSLTNVIDSEIDWQLIGGRITDGELTVTPQQLLKSTQAVLSHDKTLDFVDSALVLTPDIAMESGESYGYSDGEIDGSTSAIKVTQDDYRVLETFTNTDSNRYIAVRGKYCVVSEVSSPAELVLYDRFTMTEINRVAQPVGPVEFIDDTHIVVMSAVDLDYLTIPDLNVYQNATITATVLGDIAVGKISGKVYFSTGGATLTRRNLNGSYDTVSASFPGITNGIISFLLSDDELTVYVIDAASGSASECWLRIYSMPLMSAPSLVSSVQLTSTVNGELYSKLGWYDGYIVAKTTMGSTIGASRIHLIDISTPASPAIAFVTSNTSIYGYGGYITEGLLYLSGYQFIEIDQLPSLTDAMDAAVDWQLKSGKITDGELTVTPQQLLKSVQLANSAVQQSTVRSTSTDTEVLLSDRNNVILITNARTADVEVSVSTAVLAEEGFKFTVAVEYLGAYVAWLGDTAPAVGPCWTMNGNSVNLKSQRFEFQIIDGEAVPMAAPTGLFNPV